MNDPAHGGATTTVLLVTTGNPSLQPEVAKTHTAGVVYQPSWIPGLNLSIDWYKIDVAQAITTLPIQTIVNDCFAGVTQFCSAITRDSTGAITQIKNIPFNAQSLNTSGVDFEAGYDLELDDLHEGWLGTLSLRALATYVDKLQSQLNGITDNMLGETVQGGPPKWRGTLTASYALGPSTTVLTAQFVGAGLLDNTYKPAFINNNNVASATYFDLSETYSLHLFGVDAQVFAVVDNLFNKYPPTAVNVSTLAFSSIGTTGAWYDVIGRRYRAGLRFNF